MRFHVPNNELEKYREEQRAQREAEGVEEDEDFNDDMTASKLFNQKIVEKAKIGQTTGSVIASIQDLPMLIPRGNYSLDFYANFAKLHGKTHDYKILNKDISKIFLLNKPDGVHMIMLVQLDQPLRQGMTLHHYVAMNFEVEKEVTVPINMKEEEIKQKYGDRLQPTLQGKLYDVLSTLFMNVVGQTKIIITGDFTSYRGAKCINCSVKAAEGYLFPLKSSLVFIHKPVIYLRHSDLKHVEFSRTNQGAAASRTFDLTLTKLKDGKTE